MYTKSRKENQRKLRTWNLTEFWFIFAFFICSIITSCSSKNVFQQSVWKVFFLKIQFTMIVVRNFRPFCLLPFASSEYRCSRELVARLSLLLILPFVMTIMTRVLLQRLQVCKSTIHASPNSPVQITTIRQRTCKTTSAVHKLNHIFDKRCLRFMTKSSLNAAKAVNWWNEKLSHIIWKRTRVNLKPFLYPCECACVPLDCARPKSGTHILSKYSQKFLKKHFVRDLKWSKKIKK